MNKLTLTTLSFLLFAVLFGFNSQVSASSGSFVVCGLYFQGRVSCPEDSCYVNSSTNQFTSPVGKSYSLYTAELYDSSGQLLTKVSIDQKNGFGTLTDLCQPSTSIEEQQSMITYDWGEVRLVLPFDASASKIVIKNEKGEISDQIDLWPGAFEPNLNESSNNCSFDCPVAQSSQCNKNGICESDLSESWFTCLADCPPPSGPDVEQPRPDSGGGVG